MENKITNTFAPKAPDGAVLYREFYNTVAGVTFRNRDGVNRQSIIRRHVLPGMKLVLLLKNSNSFDHDAIALLTPNGQEIGYLHSRTATDVRDHFDRGRFVEVVVKDVTGGTSDKPTSGVNVTVRVLVVPPPPPEFLDAMSDKQVRDALHQAIQAGALQAAEDFLLGRLQKREQTAIGRNARVGFATYEQLCHLYRSQGRTCDAAAILNRYLSAISTRGAVPSAAARAILQKLR